VEWGVLTRMFHESEEFICKAFKDVAVVDYCKPLITQQMGASNSPEGWKFLKNLTRKFRYKLPSDNYKQNWKEQAVFITNKKASRKVSWNIRANVRRKEHEMKRNEEIGLFTKPSKIM